MTTTHPVKLARFITATASLALFIANAQAQHYTRTDLVSNLSGAATTTDPSLVNPWVFRARLQVPGGLPITAVASQRSTAAQA